MDPPLLSSTVGAPVPTKGFCGLGVEWVREGLSPDRLGERIPLRGFEPSNAIRDVGGVDDGSGVIDGRNLFF